MSSEVATSLNLKVDSWTSFLSARNDKKEQEKRFPRFTSPFMVLR